MDRGSNYPRPNGPGVLYQGGSSILRRRQYANVEIRYLATRTRLFFAETLHANMASQHGYIREFNPESDSIKSHLEQAQLYFEANDVAADKQVAVLLSSIGAPT